MRRFAVSTLLIASPLAGAQVVYTTIARTGDVVPNTGGLAAYRFGPAVTNDGGYVAADVQYDRTAVKHALTLFPSPSQYDPKAIQGNPAPGVDDAATFSSFYFGPPTLNAIGQLQFRTRLDNAATGNREAIFTTPSPLSAIGISMFLTAREGEQAAGLPAGVRYDRGFGNSAFLPSLLSDGGQVAFPSPLAGSGISGDYGIFAGSPGGPALVMRQGDPAPQAGYTISLNNANGVSPNINAAGQIILRTALQSGATTYQDAAVLRLTPPAGGSGAYKVEELASRGQDAPGTVNQTFGGRFSAPSLNPAGYAAFTADLLSVATPPQVVYVGKPGSLTAVARTQDVAPGTAMKFNRLSSPLLAADNTVAFTASLITTYAGNDTGLWIGQPGKLRLVAHEGDPTPAGPGTFFGDLSPSGPKFAVNSHGQVIFQASLAGPAVTSANSVALFGTDRDGRLVLLARYGQGYDFGPGEGPTKMVGAWSAVFGSNSDDGLPTAFNDRGEVVLNLFFDSGKPEEANAIVRAAIPLPGDATNDGVVGIDDFKRFYSNYGKPGGQAAGDFDGDGAVTFADYQVLQRWYGQSLDAPAAAPQPLPAEVAAFGETGVPEPGAAVAGVTFVTPLTLGRRRRRA
jgi:hypothetical protein